MDYEYLYIQKYLRANLLLAKTVFKLEYKALIKVGKKVLGERFNHKYGRTTKFLEMSKEKFELFKKEATKEKLKFNKYYDDSKRKVVVAINNKYKDKVINTLEKLENISKIKSKKAVKKKGKPLCNNKESVKSDIMKAKAIQKNITSKKFVSKHLERKI